MSRRVLVAVTSATTVACGSSQAPHQQLQQNAAHTPAMSMPSAPSTGGPTPPTLPLTEPGPGDQQAARVLLMRALNTAGIAVTLQPRQHKRTAGLLVELLVTSATGSNGLTLSESLGTATATIVDVYTSEMAAASALKHVRRTRPAQHDCQERYYIAFFGPRVTMALQHAYCAALAHDIG